MIYQGGNLLFLPLLQSICGRTRSNILEHLYGFNQY